MTLEEKILSIKKTPSEWHKPEIGVYHASSIFDICSGKLKPEDFFKEKEFSDETLLIFSIGDMYHTFIQSLFPEANTEVKIALKRDNYKIIGRVDMVVDDKIIELKSCSRLPQDPYEAHLYQVQCYMEDLGKKDAVITYIQKHQKRFPTKTFIVTYNPKIMDDIYKKVEEFNTQLCSIQKQKKQ